MSLIKKSRVQNRPIISVIVALGTRGQIGLDGGIPWDSSKDLQRFKWITIGSPVIMGRKTYESIGGPLVGRQNVIITSQQDYNAPMCNIAHNIKEAIEVLAQNSWNKEIFIIGGESIYKEVINYADMLYLIHVPYSGPADTYFPKIVGNWNRVFNEMDKDGSQFEVLWRT